MFFNQPISVTRTKAGQYVNGIWQAGQSETFTVQTSVQPTNNNDVIKLPEGRRLNQSYALYTAVPLIAAIDGVNSDKVVIYGQTYEIMHTEAWQNSIINHYKSIAVRMADA